MVKFTNGILDEIAPGEKGTDWVIARGYGFRSPDGSKIPFFPEDGAPHQEEIRRPLRTTRQG